VQAIARQTVAHQPEDFVSRFTERIEALAANQDLLVRNKWQGIGVENLARAQLAHFADLIGTRINFNGPKLDLNAAAAQAIGLALHELATNAGKYGALSMDAGRVDIAWGTEGNASG
jgi:two-component sensor histidine kinase